MVERDPSAELKAENARLIALLDANGIQWRMEQPEHSWPVSTPESSRLSTDEKVTLFRRLFRGRTDVYPIRWESKTSARDARRLGTAIISHTCSRTRQLKLESYDRLFPNQDPMPKGGFGKPDRIAPAEDCLVRRAAAFSLMRNWGRT